MTEKEYNQKFKKEIIETLSLTENQINILRETIEYAEAKLFYYNELKASFIEEINETKLLIKNSKTALEKVQNKKERFTNLQKFLTR